MMKEYKCSILISNLTFKYKFYNYFIVFYKIFLLLCILIYTLKYINRNELYTQYSNFITVDNAERLCYMKWDFTNAFNV